MYYTFENFNMNCELSKSNYINYINSQPKITNINDFVEDFIADAKKIENKIITQNNINLLIEVLKQNM